MSKILEDRYLIIRKILHLLTVFVLVIYVLLPNTQRDVFLLSLMLFVIAIEYLRLVLHVRIPFFWHLWGREEAKQPGGEFFLIVGIILAVKLFPLVIGILASLCVIFGDAVATVVGRYYGKRRIFFEKTLEGLLASIFICFVLIFSLTGSFLFAFLLALFSSFVELFSVMVDDNLVVPIVTGVFAYILWVLMPGALAFV